MFLGAVAMTTANLQSAAPAAANPYEKCPALHAGLNLEVSHEVLGNLACVYVARQSYTVTLAGHEADVALPMRVPRQWGYNPIDYAFCSDLGVISGVSQQNIRCSTL